VGVLPLSPLGDGHKKLKGTPARGALSLPLPAFTAGV
jgi:hypothetical protein